MTTGRWFWPALLSVTAVLAAMVLAAPIDAMFSPASLNFNEGWNAYYQQDAANGVPLYAKPPGFTNNNYPPVSFHLIGILSRWSGDVNRTGRWVALLSLFLVAGLCGAIVRRLGGSLALAAYAALLVVMAIGVFKPDRIGMNDPQLLGSAFNLLALYIYIRNPDRPAWAAVSGVVFAISVFTKHNLLAFPAAVALHMLFERRWRSFAAWIGAVAIASTAIVAATLRVDGPYFFSDLLAPRTSSPVALAHLADYGLMFQAPLMLGCVWAWRRRRGPGMVLALALVFANVLAAAFTGSDGVDRNIFFDTVFCLVMIASLAFASFGPALAGVFAVPRQRTLALAALLVVPWADILVQAPVRMGGLFGEAKFRRKVYAWDFQNAVAALRSHPGKALCETPLVCFEAGKTFDYDVFNAAVCIKAGRCDERDVVRLMESKTFAAIELDQRSTGPGQHLLSPKAMEAIGRNYHVERELQDGAILVADP